MPYRSHPCASPRLPRREACPSQICFRGCRLRQTPWAEAKARSITRVGLGISSRERAPSSPERTPSSQERALSSRERAPSSRERAPSPRGRVPSSPERAPSSRELTPSSREKRSPCGSERPPCGNERPARGSERPPRGSGRSPTGTSCCVRRPGAGPPGRAPAARRGNAEASLANHFAGGAPSSRERRPP